MVFKILINLDFMFPAQCMFCVLEFLHLWVILFPLYVNFTLTRYVIYAILRVFSSFRSSNRQKNDHLYQKYWKSTSVNPLSHHLFLHKQGNEHVEISRGKATHSAIRHERSTTDFLASFFHSLSTFLKSYGESQVITWCLETRL